MSGSTWPPIALAAGVLLMLLAPLAVTAVPLKVTWTDDDQRAMQQASAEYHASLHDHGSHNHRGHEHPPTDVSGSPPPADRAAENARLQYEWHQARLAAAQSRGTWILWGLRLTGVVLAGLGVWGYLRARR
jgi:hypothetical protein